MCHIGLGLVDAFLEPHMRLRMEATRFDAGLAFLSKGAAFTVVTPIAGYVVVKVIFSIHASASIPLLCR